MLRRFIVIRLAVLLCAVCLLCACAARKTAEPLPGARSFTVGGSFVQYTVPAGYHSIKTTPAFSELRTMITNSMPGMLEADDAFSTGDEQPDGKIRMMLLSHLKLSEKVDFPPDVFASGLGLSGKPASNTGMKAAMSALDPELEAFMKAMSAHGQNRLLENVPNRQTVVLDLDAYGTRMLCFLSLLNLDGKLLFVHQYVTLGKGENPESQMQSFRAPLQALNLRLVKPAP